MEKKLSQEVAENTCVAKYEAMTQKVLQGVLTGEYCTYGETISALQDIEEQYADEICDINDFPEFPTINGVIITFLKNSAAQGCNLAESVKSFLDLATKLAEDDMKELVTQNE
mgnify:CR=1 FL=1